VDWYYGVQLLQEGLPVTDVMQHGLSMKSWQPISEKYSWPDWRYNSH
jgi:hypothetical protein